MKISTRPIPHSRVLQNKILPIVVVLLTMLSGCSDDPKSNADAAVLDAENNLEVDNLDAGNTDTDTDTDTDSETDSENLASETDTQANNFEIAARAAINNGYYLKERLDYESDDSLYRHISFEVDYDALTITARDKLETAEPLYALYDFSAQGDLQTIKYYLGTGLAEPSDVIEHSNVFLIRENGLLTGLDWNYEFGAESDREIKNYYDDSGRLTYITETRTNTQAISREDFYYADNGQLERTEGNDIEFPDETTVTTFTWENGVVQSESHAYNTSAQVINYTYTYSDDGSGNISSISTTDQYGNVLFSEEYIYEVATSPVFNLILEAHYYHR